MWVFHSEDAKYCENSRWVFNVQYDLQNIKLFMLWLF